MARYQVILAYDGTEFQGFQRQAGRQDRTVQGAIEQALLRMGWQGRSILASGRTDSGVHASGQVIAFDLEWAHSLEDLRSALNAYLPATIAAKQALRVKDNFHPRYDAISRRYCYHVFCQEVRDPFRERYAWRVWPAADLDRMRTSAASLTGAHDFAAFGTPPRTGGSTIRKVLEATWEPSQGELVFSITANGFLYHMVRRLVYILVGVGQEKIDPSLIRCNLESPPAEMLQGLAPPQGLFLEEVIYPRSVLVES
jgi:tRNA pseudouridine38-40 synthase